MQKIKILLISFLLFLILSPNFSFAQSPLASNAANINYVLPYPGLLPDHPFYFLKATRDRLVEFLISDPLKKSEFYLLQADKRLNAALFLFNNDNKKVDLALSTISKGINYFDKAIVQAKEAKEEDKDILGIAGKLMGSAKKHQEVIKDIEKRAPANIRQGFARERKRMENFEKDVRSLFAQK